MLALTLLQILLECLLKSNRLYYLSCSTALNAIFEAIQGSKKEVTVIIKSNVMNSSLFPCSRIIQFSKTNVDQSERD